MYSVVVLLLVYQLKLSKRIYYKLYMVETARRQFQLWLLLLLKTVFIWHTRLVELLWNI